MAVKGFNVGGNIHQYDVNSLANIAEVTDRIDDLEDGVSALANRLGNCEMKYINAGSANSQLRITNTTDEQKYLAFGSGSGNTTILCVFYIRKSGVAFVTSLGSKAVTIAKDGEDGLLTVGTWGSAVIISDNSFTVSRA